MTIVKSTGWWKVMLKIKNKKCLLIMSLLIMSVLLVACNKDEEGLVAKVNGQVISIEEYEARYNVIRDSYKRQYGEDFLSNVRQDGRTEEERIKEEVLDELILTKIIEEEAGEMNITLTNEEVDNNFNQWKEQLGGDEALDNYLVENSIEVEVLKQSLSSPLLVKKYETVKTAEIEVGESEIESYYEANKNDLVKVRARHILLKTEEEANKVLIDLKKGKDFADLAIDKSIDYGSAKDGGDLGYFSKGEWVKDFEEQVFTLEKGELSPVIKTEIGYHIVYVEDKKEDIDSLREDIIEKIKEEKYLADLQKKVNSAKIKKYEN